MSDTLGPSPTLVISNLPPKTLVGIDLLSFASTPNFHGIKDIPPGAHFLYTGATESFSLRSGEWFLVPDPTIVSRGALQRRGHGNNNNNIDVRLREWDGSLETLALIDESQDVGKQRAMQQRANLSQIWAAGGLLAYRSRQDEKQGKKERNEDVITPGRGDWNILTSYISQSVLDRILGKGEIDQEARSRWVVTSGSSAEKDADHIPGLTEAEIASAGGVAGEKEKDLKFLPIDLKKTWREGAVGRERTDAAQDRSWALGNLVSLTSSEADTTGSGLAEEENINAGEAHILGEIQFTFLMVLTLMNFSCLEQWKRLLGLIFTCRAAIKEREQFFVKVIQLLRIQLVHCSDVEGGLFEMDGDDGGALLKNLLTSFKRTIDDATDTTQSAIKSEFEKLAKWLQNEYGWELSRGSIVRRGILELEDGEQVEMEVSGAAEEDETGEYAPVILDLEGVGGEVEDEDMDMTPGLSLR